MNGDFSLQQKDVIFLLCFVNEITQEVMKLSSFCSSVLLPWP